MKKIISLILVSLFLVASPCTFAKDGNEKSIKDSTYPKSETISGIEYKTVKTDLNTFIQNTYKDFETGKSSDLIISKKGCGGIILSPSKLTGTYESPIIYSNEFNNMVISWNADTPEGTSISVYGRASVDDKWSSWLCWGKWGSTFKSSSCKPDTTETKDELASVGVDTLTINDPQKAASKYQYKVILDSNKSGVTPSVNLLAASVKNSNIKKDEVKKEIKNPKNIALNVPTFSQFLRAPDIKDSICSPTSLAMVLNYYGVRTIPEEVAWNTFDKEYGDFGNWPFNTAFAGSLGFDAYVSFLSDIDDVKKELKNNHPVILSVWYRNDESVNEPTLPVLHGAPIASTYGHLIVATGTTYENGIYYILVNDPAASNNNDVKRKYKEEELQKAWANRAAYIIHNKNSTEKPVRNKAVLKNTGKTKVSAGKTLYEYSLNYKGAAVDLTKENTGTIMIASPNSCNSYITLDGDNSIWLDKNNDVIKSGFFIITKDKKAYMGSSFTKFFSNPLKDMNLHGYLIDNFREMNEFYFGF